LAQTVISRRPSVNVHGRQRTLDKSRRKGEAFVAQAPSTEESAPPPLDPHRHALFLDFDGVLVEIAPTPDAVRVEADGGAGRYCRRLPASRCGSGAPLARHIRLKSCTAPEPEHSSLH
jgi:hypothetical protein